MSSLNGREGLPGRSCVFPAATLFEKREMQVLALLLLTMLWGKVNGDVKDDHIHTLQSQNNELSSLVSKLQEENTQLKEV